MAEKILLAGDIGGTKTTLALYAAPEGKPVPRREETFASGDYPDLESIVAQFLGRGGRVPESACFGVAGPVIDGRAVITKLPWRMSEQGLAAACGIGKVRLINDLVATASALPILAGRDLVTIKEGRAAENGVVAVIAPGTGLGEAFMIRDGDRYRPFGSEGGHCDFAPANELQLQLLRYMLAGNDHVSFDRLCSGQGIPDIYRFLLEKEESGEPDWLKARRAGAKDEAPVIMEAALAGKAGSGTCRRTLEIFVSILGSEAGNLALKVLATGGVYLGGGIPPKILPALQENIFTAAFTAKGRLSHVVEKIPVHVILNPKAALLGAAVYGLKAEG